MIQIDIDTIEILMNRFIKKIRESKVQDFYFNDDYYWCVSEDDLTNMDEVPQLMVGSLKDDVDFLRSLIEEDYDTGFLDLERLSVIFKYLSKQLI